MLPTQKDTTPILIFNPSKEDYHDQLAEEDGIHQYIMPSRQIITLPKYIADHLAKHLASKLALEDSSRIHFEDRYKKQLEKIYVTL